MRYAVFAGENYYPLGGWDDLKLLTNDYDEALEFCETATLVGEDRFSRYDWAHVIDLQTGERLT